MEKELPVPARARGTAFLLLAALLSFGGILGNGFAWDDQGILVEDEGVRSLSGLKGVLFRADTVWSTERNPYYRPLSRGAYVVEYALFGPGARGYHAVSLALHLGNVFLLLAISRLLVGAGPAAFIAPFLLAVHPVSVEAVAFASTQNTLWAALFSQLALLAALRGRGAAAAGAFFLGLLSKETAAMALPVVAFSAFFAISPARAGEDRRTLIRSRLRTAALLALVLVPYLALRSNALEDVARVSGGAPGLGSRLVANVAVVPEYVAMLVVPWKLNAYRTLPPLEAGALPGIVLGWLAVAALFTVGWRRGGALGRLGLAWAALNFLPASGIVPIPSAPLAERYAYLPAMGAWLVLAGVAAAEMRRRAERSRSTGQPAGDSATSALPPFALLPAAVPFLAAVLLLGVLSARRTAVWRNDLALFSDTVAASPAAALPRFNLGNALLERGDLAGARRQWQEAVRVDPGFSRAWNHLANAARTEGDASAAEALYRRALSARDPNPEAAYNLALLLDGQGRTGEALAAYERFLSNAPRESAAAAAFARERVRRLRGAASP